MLLADSTIRIYVKRALRRIGLLKPQKQPPIALPNREPVDPRSGIAAVTLTWNEGPDLREWIEFHRLAGINHIYLYDDGSTDDTAHLVQPYVKGGLVTFIPWGRFSNEHSIQRLAYAHAICTFGGRWRWMAFIDLDEFLFCVEDEPLGDALSRFSDLPALAVPWHLFGFSGHDARPPGLVIENYRWRIPFPPPSEPSGLLNWKCIVDPSAVTGIYSPHLFVLIDGRRGAYSEDRKWIDRQRPAGWEGLRSEVFRLNHYFTKSKEDFERRRSTGRSVASGRSREAHLRRAVNYANRIEESASVEDNLIIRFAPRLKSRLNNDRGY